MDNTGNWGNTDNVGNTDNNAMAIPLDELEGTEGVQLETSRFSLALRAILLTLAVLLQSGCAILAIGLGQYWQQWHLLWTWTETLSKNQTS